MTSNIIPFPERAEVTSIADVLRSLGADPDAQPAVVTRQPADRVHHVARDAGAMSGMVVRAMRTLGYEGIKSPSSRVNLSPIEREALIATVDALYPRDPRFLVGTFLHPHNPDNNPA